MNIQKKWYGFFVLMVIMWGGLLTTPSVKGAIGIAVLSVISFLVVQHSGKVLGWLAPEEREQPVMSGQIYQPDLRHQRLQVFRRRLAAKVRDFNMPPPVWVRESNWRTKTCLFVPCWWQFESVAPSTIDHVDIHVALCWSNGRELTWYPADAFRGRQLIHSDRCFPTTRTVRMEWKGENGISLRELSEYLKLHFNL